MLAMFDISNWAFKFPWLLPFLPFFAVFPVPGNLWKLTYIFILIFLIRHSNLLQILYG